ncbi:MAG TPA: VLRF1 family aeRF1-type release factor [Solirubrobacterales bacterium]|nr:VLRF1 family aeRF1-type release factor [Solirubrobacterales bacterium]
MTQPTLEDARKLSEWRPPLGVLSVYLGFDPADRGGAWRTELRNGLDAILDAQKEAEHDRRVALRATAKRLTERFEDGDLRPPPRGEFGFVEVAEKEGTERWFGAGVAPADPCVEFGAEPLVAPLLELRGRGAARAIVLLSAERVRLLSCDEGALEELEDWELSITSLDWRERKSQSASDPARAQGVSSSGHDQFGERLEHNRRRFLAECGGLVANQVAADGFGGAIAFGSSPDFESFESGYNFPRVELVHGGDADLISAPKSKVGEVAAEVTARLDEERERAVVERALAEVKGGARGAGGPQETGEALAEGRVDHLVLDAAVDRALAESLIRGALAGGAQVTIVRDERAAPLAESEGVAAILRY